MTCSLPWLIQPKPGRICFVHGFSGVYPWLICPVCFHKISWWLKHAKESSCWFQIQPEGKKWKRNKELAIEKFFSMAQPLLAYFLQLSLNAQSWFNLSKSTTQLRTKHSNQEPENTYIQPMDYCINEEFKDWNMKKKSQYSQYLLSLLSVMAAVNSQFNRVYNRQGDKPIRPLIQDYLD